ncbi:GNAT family N-acetyltransferase [Actinokineospora sp. PR83]|uniref:GNAT family N-acetyltransferase n=1 Tax=Actinokineospora sp. PR83 TaxID=2884908 RepID=UPI0027DFC626|nr:GNAT family N-acetyltransferase [Actinokineospora sp. PR83]MCG8920171.1 GNAT family N-acetyltransferase [Actinokineospora sp. PR83]
MDVIWRPLTPADGPAWVACAVAVEAEDRTGEHLGADDFAWWLDDPGTDLARDSLGAFAGDDLLAYAFAPGLPGGDRVELRIEGAVHPAHRRRGLGRELLTRVIAAGEARYPVLEAHVRAYDGNPGQEALLAEFGFTTRRWFFDMTADLTGAAPATVPAGFAVERFTEAHAEELRLLRNRSFADHWGSPQHDPEQWRARFLAPNLFVPGLTFQVRDAASGALAAFVLSHHHAADSEARGHRELWVAAVGTDPGFRGRGLGGALLAHTLHAGAAAGYASAGLSVDADNPTGALGIYRRAGFTPSARWTVRIR